MQKRRAVRSEREAMFARIEKDEHLRKLRNSSAALCGVQYQGSDIGDVFGALELRALLRRELERYAASRQASEGDGDA
jgi:hypothetical protein